MYGNDLNRGLDVYRFDAGAPAAAGGGTWMTPQQALSRAQSLGVTESSGESGGACGAA